jgi:restriction endonuclease S subunit
MTARLQFRRLKYFVELNDSGVWGDDPVGADDAIVLRSTDIALDGSWTISDPAVRSIPLRDRQAKTLAEGDLVVVTSSGSAAHLGKTARVSEEVAELRPCFSNFVQRLRANEKADSRYLYYLLNSTYGASQLEMLGTTTTGLRNLNGAILGAVSCPAVSVAEQREIADFLDAETARIDALVARKLRMIDVLEERRVTVTVDGVANSASELHPAGTVVLSRTASVGFSAIMARPMATSQDFATWTCGASLWPRFLLLCLRAMRAELLGRLAMGSTHKTIYMPDIEGIRIPLPSLEEQDSIVDEVWERLWPIDAAVSAIERQIDLLREHRHALINAAVTDQLDLAGTAA